MRKASAVAMKMPMNEKEIDRLYEVALWYKKLCDTNNEVFIPLFADKHRYLVLKGGGGSGKSIFAGRKILERAISEPGHRFLVCRKVARTIRESCFKQLLGQLAEHYPDSEYKANKGDLAIYFPNGSEIIFAGLDDVEKLKSIYNITGIWIEEASELLEGDFNQLDIRLRGETRYYKQIIISFNPISINHWLKKRFFDFDIADPAALEKARRRTRTHESTYKDNRFLDEEAKATLEAFRETDEYYYQVYCLGMWGVTGKSVFDAKAIARRLAEKIEPKRRGLFSYEDNGLALAEISFTDEKGGCISVFREPEPGVPYVIGADTAGEGSDYFAASVLDNRTGEQICTLHGKFDEDVFARQLFCLGMWYNEALIGPEANFSTYPILELERLGYKNLYVRETIDEFTHDVKRSYGFLTNTKTRPVIIANLIKVVREDITVLNDQVTMEEMLTFIRNPETLKPEAEPGSHDDTVMALCIAHYIRPQQSYLAEPSAGMSAKWSESQWEDYENASPEQREYLIKIWGNPR
jgi:phage terminase large subunit